ncbi:MAG: radical SAM protein [Candidatus Woesearchaeota archaeon]|jgi:radical SAM protein with 4Fe4S-binding SPASM domain|nr:radical SAM protein [Candidatus Woesearchaeota archaeon]|tara:strand:- start:7235 stop:8191 length:957 start_codon:yes stop_codon:yes gene_type:complete
MQNIEIPNEIVLELTRKCNLSCDFCFNEQGMYNTNDMPLDDIFKVLDDISKSGIKAVRFTGGEPFLRKDLSKILKKAKSLELYVILNTNGFLINKKNKKFFNYVDLVILSLHDLGRFGKVINAMVLIKDFHTKIMLATIATKNNIDNIERYYEFASKINNKNFSEWFLLRPIPNKNDKNPINQNNIRDLYNKIKKYNEEYKINVKIANSLPFCAINENLSSICKGGFFDSGYSRLVIDCNGNYKTDYYTANILGNIHENAIMQIWNSEEMKDIRNYGKVNKKCITCHHLEGCKGGLIGNESLYDFNNIVPLKSILVPT